MVAFLIMCATCEGRSCTRNDSNDDSYPGHGYSDGKAAAEDADYHSDPSSYDGR